MVPVVTLALILLEPSRGSKAIMYFSRSNSSKLLISFKLLILSKLLLFLIKVIFWLSSEIKYKYYYILIYI